MATKLTKRGKLDNEITYEFVCDTSADLQAIGKQYIVLGSTAIVLEGDVGFEVYMANSQKEWVNIGGGGSNNSGSSEPVWVNQDIFTSIPEIISSEDNGETHYYATNMSLNNHVIQGNIVADYATSDFSVGYLNANINPSLTTSFMDIRNTEPELNQEYYVICISIPASAYGITDDIINTLMVPAPVFTNDMGLGGDVAFQITSVSDTLYIYKVPGYICASFLNYNNPLLIHYLLSSLQPEATYDVSQITYETPQAGE